MANFYILAPVKTNAGEWAMMHYLINGNISTVARKCTFNSRQLNKIQEGDFFGLKKFFMNTNN